jgi:hypothetical protein
MTRRLRVTWTFRAGGASWSGRPTPRPEAVGGLENRHDIGVFCRSTTWPRRLDLEWTIIVGMDPAIIAIVFERQRTPSGLDHGPLVGAWVVTP